MVPALLLLLAGFKQNYTLKSHPSLVCHKRQLNPVYCHCFILYYSFFYFFLYFILQVKPWLEKIQGAPPLHQTSGNVGNSNPSRLESSKYRKGGYAKISAIDPTEANTGLFHPSFFVLVFPTRMSLNFYRTITHGSNSLHTAPSACTWNRLRRTAGPHAHPGLPLGI